MSGPAPSDASRLEANASARTRRRRNARMSKVAGAVVAALVAGLQAWNMADSSGPVYCPPAVAPPAATVTATVTARARSRRPRPTPAAYSPAPSPSSHPIP